MSDPHAWLQEYLTLIKRMGHGLDFSKDIFDLVAQLKEEARPELTPLTPGRGMSLADLEHLNTLTDLYISIMSDYALDTCNQLLTHEREHAAKH